MLISAIISFFRYKVVRSIIIVACWRPFEQVQFIREISNYGFAATFACEPDLLNNVHVHGLQGVVYFDQINNKVLNKVRAEHFSNTYVWLIVGDRVPPELSRFRYDAEIALLFNQTWDSDTRAIVPSGTYELVDVHALLGEGTSTHPWAYWTQETGLNVLYERERILRRFNFEGYPLRIAAPMGQYSESWYNGSYAEYVVDETLTELDAGIRCGYAASSLIIQLLNATELLITVELWGSTINNSSMLLKLMYGDSELSGGILRILTNRNEMVDYVMPIWPFAVGFTYLAERESSSNMFVEPFTVSVWWCCLGITMVLAISLRTTARSREEKDDSFCTVLATFLQQDASAVPKSLSGRWTFIVLSVCAMLVHAYYTSAIVSALMSAGSGGPDSLRALADSKYTIASEDYEYMRYLFFDVETTWDDLEYLKKKKKTSKFYQSLEKGVKLIQDGSTAFHSEYNQIYPHFKTFTDEQICKLQHVDTIPEVMTWIASNNRGQYTNAFRAAGAWLHEVGLSKRTVTRLKALRPACRAQLIAERVKFGDVASLMGLTAFGAVLSLVLLGLEILVAKNAARKMKRLQTISGSLDTMDVDIVEEY